MGQKPEIVTVEQQLEIVRNVQDLTDFGTFYHQYYSYDNWPFYIGDYLKIRPEIQKNQAFFQILTFNALMFRQAEFGSMGPGLTVRHTYKKWQLPHLGLRHQLALSCYGGNINDQAYPYKERIAQITENKAPDMGVGAWGLRFEPQKGRITPPKASDDALIRAAISRYLDSGSPILLPFQEKNHQLAQLNFTGDDAERMTTEEIDTKIRPQVAQILKGVINTDQLFIPGTY